MASGDPAENENSVTLFLKYKQEFEDVILDIYNNKSGVKGENPGKKCAAQLNHYPNFTNPCQDVGRYLIEIKEHYKDDSLKRCKYLNYKINSDNNYNEKPEWFQGYNEFSSLLGNICVQKFTVIQPDILKKLKDLYINYDDFEKFNGQDKDTSGNICNNIRNLYSFYMNNYEECQRNNEGLFCEELNNFKKAYDYKMNNFTPCNGLPQTLPQIEKTSTQILSPKEEVDYLFVPIITTAIVLLMSFTILFLYKFTPLKFWTYNRLRKKKIIELNKFQEESSESLQNLHEEVNRNYEGSSHNISYQPQGHT
ncbi:PIR protein [Plasmodium malariae]|uniref:PIR protein n=3 Tax=Plasmodium malariae TaxID=5858 RepID=A0A1D3RJN1_PLAMA|nr:PIR protein [Plasmodium malariae]SCN45388.1 PIR protein [Plasmodium malariae]